MDPPLGLGGSPGGAPAPASPDMGWAQVAPDPPRACRLQFTGSGREYFRIWLTNLALTLVTLGLYGAWAKVRRLQYFHRNTLLDGVCFDYVARPAGILAGRIVALLLFVLYTASFYFSSDLGLAVSLGTAAVLPWLLWKSNRFKTRYTRHRGLRFGFTGSLGGAYLAYLPLIVVVFAPTVVAAVMLDRHQETLVLLSGGGFLLIPYLHALFRRYVQAGLSYGDSPFRFNARHREFISIYIRGVGLMILLWMPFSMVIFGHGIFETSVNDDAASKATFMETWLMVVPVILALVYLAAGSYFLARLQTLVWGRTRAPGVRLRCDIQARKLWWLLLSNFLATVFTLGLFRPFAAVRMARYRLETVTVLVEDDALDQFKRAAPTAAPGATGEAAAELFDMDLAL